MTPPAALAYDLDTEALYITLGDTTIAASERIDDETLVDVDIAGNPVGVEVLNYRRPWPLPEILGRYPIAETAAQQLCTLYGTEPPCMLIGRP